MGSATRGRGYSTPSGSTIAGRPPLCSLSIADGRVSKRYAYATIGKLTIPEIKPSHVQPTSAGKNLKSAARS
jgi:hypothetical protein